MAGKILGFKVRTDNKLRGAYGETDFGKKIIRINKNKHRKDYRGLRRLTPNKDHSENLLTTIVHEVNHVRHPRMKERGIEKLAQAMKSRMSPKQKRKYYSLAA